MKTAYVERHDGAAVTCENFIKAFEDANDTDLSQFRRWYEQAGTPKLKIDRSYDPASGELTLNVGRVCLKPPDTAQPPGYSGQPGVGADGGDVPIRIRAATSLLKMHP